MALLTFMLAAASVPVYTGTFDPANFPNLITVERRVPHAELTSRVEEILADGRCRIEGQNKRRFDFDVRFALLLDANRKVHSVVVENPGCKDLAKLVGEAAVAQAANNEFRVAHTEGARWYVSSMYFALGEPISAAAIADKDKQICRRNEPVLGSRTKFQKICMTAAQWQAHELDRQQLRRDILNSARDCIRDPDGNCS